MTIIICGRTLATVRPADLDARLIASTGCSAAEHAKMLARGGDAFHTARALQPMLDDADAMSVADLATLIAGGDVLPVRRTTVEMLTAEQMIPATVAAVADPVALPTLPAAPVEG